MRIEVDRVASGQVPFVPLLLNSLEKAMFTIQRSLMSLSLVVVSFGALAQTPAPKPAPAGIEQRFDNRQTRQEQRIDQGVASGRLTPAETARLEGQQTRLAHAESRVESDGVVTRKEAIHLEKRQDKASRNIYRQKHDARPR
jgi:hypothetical protein